MRLSLIPAAVFAAALAAAPCSARLIETENVLDNREQWVTNIIEIDIFGQVVTQEFTREFERYFGSINADGDVMVFGSFDKNNTLPFEDRPGFVMYSAEGEHNGRPDMILLTETEGSPISVSPVDGRTVDIFIPVQTNNSGLIGVAGFRETDGNGITSLEFRLERYTGLGSGNPTFEAAGRFGDNLRPPFEYDPTPPNIDATTTNNLPVNGVVLPLIFSNPDGDQQYFIGVNQDPNNPNQRVNALYRRDSIGSDATVERLAGYEDLPGMGGDSFNPAYINNTDFFGAVDRVNGESVLITRDPANGQLRYALREGQAIPGDETFFLRGIGARDALDATSDGLLLSKLPTRDTLTDAENTSLVTTDVTTGLSKVAVTEGTAVSAWGAFIVNVSEAKFDVNGDIIFSAFVNDGVGNGFTNAASGLFRYDVSRDAIDPLVAGLTLGTFQDTVETGLSGTDITSLDPFLVAVPHESGFVYVTGGASDADGPAGDVLFAIAPDGEIIPVILPGDTVELADGTIIAVDSIDPNSFGDGGVFGMRTGESQILPSPGTNISPSGLAVLGLTDANGLGGLFTIQLPVPEPTSALLLVGAVGLVAVRRRHG